MFRWFRKNDPAPPKTSISTPLEVENNSLRSSIRSLEEDGRRLRNMISQLSSDKRSLLRSTSLMGKELDLALFTRDSMQKKTCETIDELRALRQLEQLVRPFREALVASGKVVGDSPIDAVFAKLDKIRGPGPTVGALKQPEPPPVLAPPAGTEDDDDSFA